MWGGSLLEPGDRGPRAPLREPRLRGLLARGRAAGTRGERRRRRRRRRYRRGWRIERVVEWRRVGQLERRLERQLGRPRRRAGMESDAQGDEEPSDAAPGDAESSGDGGGDAAPAANCGTMTCDLRTSYCYELLATITFECQPLPACDAANPCSCIKASGGADVCSCAPRSTAWFTRLAPARFCGP